MKPKNYNKLKPRIIKYIRELGSTWDYLFHDEDDILYEYCETYGVILSDEQIKDILYEYNQISQNS